MPAEKLHYDGKTYLLSSDVTTIGRTTDNHVSFPDDPNVSRNHAEIELRGQEYCIIDLGSSNGTTVNGERVSGEKFLLPGDVILLGGSSELTFGGVEEEATSEPEDQAPQPESESGQAQASTPENSDAAAAAGSSGSKIILIVAGAIVCFAILFVAIAAGVYLLSGSSGTGSASGGGTGGGSKPWFSSIFGSTCDAKATILKPETGDTIYAATEIEVDVLNGDCVSKAVFTIDGKPFFASSEQPFMATIDPTAFPELSDGADHSIGMVLLDDAGEPIGENASVLVGFETRAVTKPSPEEQVAQTDQQKSGTDAGGAKQVSLIEVQEMSKRLVQQFTGKRDYNVSNKQFLAEVQKKTAEYAQEGYFERALKYRDAINVAFVREQNIDAPLGFLLAMSRSKFDPAKQGADEGIWRMSNEFAAANGYNGLCGSETLSDPSQNCAAKASALYMKALVFGVFDGDPIYSSVVFGKSPQDAGIWKSTLPANRSDLWNSIKTPQEREQLVRFFAAGIVAENPQKFGLKKDRPLSELYRLAM